MTSSALENFDPTGPAHSEGIFGLPFKPQNAALVLVAVPFEATTSYGGGTSKGPANIFEASQQVDLFHPIAGDAWKKGIALAKTNPQYKSLNSAAKKMVGQIRKLEAKPNKKSHTQIEKLQKQVNATSEKVNALLKKEAETYLSQNKVLGVIGGDHSIPFSAIEATLKRHPEMGILHFDAHFDLRKAYEGFTHSHASIFYNVITRLPLKKLTHIGIRDYSPLELAFAKSHKQISYFLDADLFAKKSAGETWQSITREVIETLPNEVYISFDIDGLDPALCQSTGTPVPGGLQFNEAIYILRSIIQSGRKIVGFDLCEVGEAEFDGNIGARILFELCNLSLMSR